jgi:hypothetical protein
MQEFAHWRAASPHGDGGCAGSLSRGKHRLFGPIWTMYRQDQQLGLPQASAAIALYALNGVLREHVPGFIHRVGFL